MVPKQTATERTAAVMAATAATAAMAVTPSAPPAGVSLHLGGDATRARDTSSLVAHTRRLEKRWTSILSGLHSEANGEGAMIQVACI